MVVLLERNRKKTGKELTFPSWKSLMNQFIIENWDPKLDKSFRPKDLGARLRLLDLVKKCIREYHPSQTIALVSEPCGNYLMDTNFEELLLDFKNSSIAANQFYSVYDIKQGYHTIIDPYITTALGISAEEFSLPAMAGLDETNPLYHPDDVNHMIRWASIAYMMLSLPGFDWSRLKDYYYVSHRVGTKKSMNKELIKKDYVTLEKRCFPLFGSDEKGKPKQIYHFDQWSVLDAIDFDYVKPRWITSPQQSEKMNALFYLFNAYLLDVSPKHIAMLNAKLAADRNKAIANSFNTKIEKGAGIKASYDEIQIGNAFSKTIRSKISSAMNIWDKRSGNNTVRIESDHDAVHYAKTLGLLPLPKVVEDLIFKSVIH